MAPYSDERLSAPDGLYPSRRRPSHGRRSRDPSPEPSRLKPESRHQASRHGSSRNPSRARSPQPPVYPNTPVKRTWPPAPAVEDEKTALAKEANAPRVADCDKSEARSRGTLDQQPIILDVELPKQARDSTRPGQQRGPRDSSDKYNIPGPVPTISTESRTRGGQGSDDESQEPPETPLTRRTASPYVFMPKAPDASKIPPNDSGYFSSSTKPSNSTPTAEKRRGLVGHGETLASDALRGNGKIRYSSDNEGSIAADSGVAIDDDEESTVVSRASAPYAFSKAGGHDKESRPAVRDFAKADPRLAEIKAEALDSQRRRSESASAITRPAFEDTSRISSTSRRGPPAPISPSIGQAAGEASSRPSSRQSSGSRPSSPVGNPYNRPPSPPRSPRFGNYPSRNEPSMSARSSVSNSTNGSRPPSRPPSPGFSMPRPEEGIRRSTTFPMVLEDRSQRTSRLADSSVHVDDNLQSPMFSSRQQWNAPSSLPYPVDDMTMMPSEEEHRYKLPSLGDAFIPRPYGPSSRPSTRDGPPESPVTSRPTSLELPPSRPSMVSRHTLTGDLPTLATGVAAAAATTSVDSPVSARPGGASSKRTRCLKVQSARDFDDWYTLPSCSDFDICPSCFDSFIAPGNFRNSFTHVPRREPNPNVTCSFRTPWYKLAWELTEEQQRFDLDLLYAVARATESEPQCPGKDRENRPWRAVYDKRGEAVHGFDICPCDVRRVEALMPSLRGVFQESHNSGRRRRCNLRTVSARCAEYLDELREIDAAASRKRKPADMTSFIELARHKAQMRECARDDLVVDKEWHFAPQLPQFTVCEECYSSVIWPAIADGSSVAGKFKRTPELVYEEKDAGGRDTRRGTGGVAMAGTSCQLYSPRMRSVFRKAVQTDDFSYLATRAKERKDVEMELQAKYARLQAMAREFERSTAKGNASGGDRRSLQAQQRYAGLMADFDKIGDEWRKWE